MVNPIVAYVDRQTKKIEEQTEALIRTYMQMLSSSADARAVRDLAREGSASAAEIADRALPIHTELFSQVMSNSRRDLVLRKKQRVQLIEQFCVALWIKFVGREGFDLMRERLGLVGQRGQVG
ncbi:MAG: hypothetical protein M3164_02960 [Actinomycetota bacterium]|nr:hypothetical protein [Actinomycetota bacterium]